ncbi:hypothetical protein [Mesorhizobium sp. SP-1A]|uniref:hypothetical protein n=1 Tax=Mesorhizobium sp. SP-1A TaxID=3077840 RepID=UPI0028F6C356|nr:hypothetical protein [Mesorhizobium sp. SP-1A]
MASTQNNYSPWERTESDDLQILQALDQCSEHQLSSLVDELFKIADQQSDEKNNRAAA